MLRKATFGLLGLLATIGCTSGDPAAEVEAGSGGASADGAPLSTGGTSSGGGASTGGTATDGGVLGPAIVAVGYAGLRVVSYDLGKTWEHEQTLGTAAVDDPTLLRTATFGAGLFVATGHRIFTSPDGATWTERTNPEAQWLGGAAYGVNRFVATGGSGYSLSSLDGTTWFASATLGTESSRSLAFGNGEFMAHTDPGNWWSSPDGTLWTLRGGGHTEEIAFCDGSFRDASACGPAAGFGVFVRSGGWDSGVISRSTDGATWEDVTVGFVGDVTAFAFGMVRH